MLKKELNFAVANSLRNVINFHILHSHAQRILETNMADTTEISFICEAARSFEEDVLEQDSAEIVNAIKNRIPFSLNNETWNRIGEYLKDSLWRSGQENAVYSEQITASLTEKLIDALKVETDESRQNGQPSPLSNDDHLKFVITEGIHNAINFTNLLKITDNALRAGESSSKDFRQFREELKFYRDNLMQHNINTIYFAAAKEHEGEITPDMRPGLGNYIEDALWRIEQTTIRYQDNLPDIFIEQLNEQIANLVQDKALDEQITDKLPDNVIE